MSDSTFSALWGFMIAIINIGALVGVFFSPTLNERLGRKGTLLLNNIPNLLGTLLFCLARKFYSIEMFAVGRFLVGINLGVANGALGLYLTEISPSEVRGLMGSLQGLMKRNIRIIRLIQLFLNSRNLLMLYLYIRYDYWHPRAYWI